MFVCLFVCERRILAATFSFLEMPPLTKRRSVKRSPAPLETKSPEGTQKTENPPLEIHSLLTEANITLENGTNRFLDADG